MSDPIGYDPDLGYQDAPYVPNLDPLPIPPVVVIDYSPTTYPSLSPEEPHDDPADEPPAGG